MQKPYHLDVYDCKYNNGGCHRFATCRNTPGVRNCTCITGFGGDGLTCYGNDIA